MDNQSRTVIICDECSSEYHIGTSQMNKLCPECSYILYGYENCEHEFNNGRCIKCFWNGNSSDYIRTLKEKQLIKNKGIFDIINFFQGKYGASDILINDHWECDKGAIGLTDKSGQFLAYISINSDNSYYLALENPPVNNELPYSPAGDFNYLSLKQLENLIVRHLKLPD